MKVTIKRGSYTRREGDRGRVRYPRGATLEMSEAEAKSYGHDRLVIGGKIIMPAKAPLEIDRKAFLGDDADAEADKAKREAAQALLDKAKDTPAPEFRAMAADLLGEEFRTEKAAVAALEAVARPTE